MGMVPANKFRFKVLWTSRRKDGDIPLQVMDQSGWIRGAALQFCENGGPFHIGCNPSLKEIISQSKQKKKKKRKKKIF